MNWNKTDKEMFRAIPPSTASGEKSLAEAVNDAIQSGVEYENGRIDLYSKDISIEEQLEAKLIRHIDDAIDRHMEYTDGYIGIFPEPKFKVKRSKTHCTQRGSYTKEDDVDMNFFRGWRYLPHDAPWDDVISAGYPGGHLFNIVDTAYNIFEQSAPVRYAFHKVVKNFLQFLLIAVFSLFIYNEFWAMTAIADGELPSYAGIFGKIHVLESAQKVISLIPFGKYFGAGFSGAACFAVEILLGVLCYKIFTRCVNELMDSDGIVDSMLPLCFMLGFPLLFAIYPHALVLIPMFALGVGFLVTGFRSLRNLFRWIGRLISCFFSRKDNTEEVHELTAKFENDAYIMHRYVRLRILWANAKNNGKYPKKLDKIEKKLQKVDKLVRRYGIQ